MAGRFAGKTIVITGASGGIGAAMAARFAAEGANVMVSAIDDKLADVAGALKNSGAPVASLRMDVTKRMTYGGFMTLQKTGSAASTFPSRTPVSSPLPASKT